MTYIEAKGLLLANKDQTCKKPNKKVTKGLLLANKDLHLPMTIDHAASRLVKTEKYCLDQQNYSIGRVNLDISI